MPAIVNAYPPTDEGNSARTASAVPKTITTAMLSPACQDAVRFARIVIGAER